MKLPNADRAIIDMRKLTEYSLNLRHRHGKEKAVLFRGLLGLTLENAQVLYDALADAVRTYDAEETILASMGSVIVSISRWKRLTVPQSFEAAGSFTMMRISRA